MRRDSRQFEIFVQAQGGPQSKIVAEPKTSKMETRRDNLAYEQWRENLHRHSYDMDSRSLQTGLFLHQFTNSVSRALHKDNDQQSKRLSAEELYAKANPAIFTTNFNARSKVPTAQVHLPAISKLGVVGDLLNQNNNSLKFRLMKESRVPGKSRKAQSLQPHIVEDYHLPRIMEITDKEGNNWKIQQQQKSAKSSNDKVEAENERVPARIPPIEPLLVHDSVTAKPSAAESVGFGKRPNKTQDTQPKLPQINKNTHLTWEKKKDSETELEASDLEDESLDLNTPRRGQTDKFNPLSTYKSYQNKMSYSSYLKQMSLPDVHDTTAGLSPANVNDAGNCLQIRGKSTTNEESGDVKYKSLDVYCPRNDRESEESSSEKDSPAEEVMTPRRHGNKENATPRKDAETHKVEVGKHIPKNFTEKQQQELRSRYPMYDWQWPTDSGPLVITTGTRTAGRREKCQVWRACLRYPVTAAPCSE
ncbi:uncharacterized protein [Ptychodera flava]|uniref:uncharacterized protein isoform X2 n=1 Tax=Ptychodera flava TaxID=63121 RepID=UPI00396A2282